MTRRIRKPGAKGAGNGTGNENDRGGNDYDVGYGKPPVHSQFQKGQSGNPKGKPKGRKNTRTMIRDILFEPLAMQINGRTQNLTGFEGNLLRLRQAGLGGDYRSAVHVVQLGQSVDDDVTSEKPEVEAVHFDRRTFNALLRDYLKHNGSVDDATASGPASPDDGEEDA